MRKEQKTGFADQIFKRNETDVNAAVVRTVTVITHHEIISLRHRQLWQIIFAFAVGNLQNFMLNVIRQRFDILVITLGIALTVTNDKNLRFLRG